MNPRSRTGRPGVGNPCVPTSGLADGRFARSAGDNQHANLLLAVTLQAARLSYCGTDFGACRQVTAYVYNIFTFYLERWC